eukprot:1140546-Pelagomonas_calceolata.AAC.1
MLQTRGFCYGNSLKAMPYIYRLAGTRRALQKPPLKPHHRDQARAVRQGTPIPIQEFTDDLRHRLRAVWREFEGVNPRDTFCKLATYQSLFAVPFDHNVRAPARLLRHMHLDLSQHVMRNVSRLRIRANTLKVETVAWDAQNALLCDRFSCDEIQNEAHALLVCRDADVCTLRRKCAYLFNCLSGDFSMEQPYLH